VEIDASMSYLVDHP